MPLKPGAIAQSTPGRVSPGQEIQPYRRQIGGVGGGRIVGASGFSAMADLFGRMGQAAGALGADAIQQHAEEIADRSARAAEVDVLGARDVADIRLPTGTTIADQAYRRSAEAAVQARLETDAIGDVTRLSEQYRGRPDAFRDALTDVAQTKLGALDPQLRTNAGALYTRLGGRAYRALADEVVAVEIDRSRAEMDTSFTAILTQARQLARSGDQEGALALIDMIGAKLEQSAPLAAGGTGLYSFGEIAERTDAAVSAVREDYLAGWALRDPNGAWTALHGGNSFKTALVSSESSGNAASTNQLGYAGLAQFGMARLADLGFYRPAAGEDLNGRQQTWQGQFVGLPGVRTIQDFLANPEAQQLALDRHLADIDRKIDGDGLLTRFAGRTVAGVPINRNSIRAMAHLGGYDGARRFLESGGQYDPADDNGTRLSDYGKKFAGVESNEGLLTATGDPVVDSLLAEATPEEQDRLSSVLFQTVAEQRSLDLSAEKARLSDLNARWQDIADLTARGITTPELGALKEDAVGTPLLADILKAERDSFRVKAFSMLPLPEQQAALVEQDRRIQTGAIPASEVELAGVKADAYARTIKAVREDPLVAYGQQLGRELPSLGKPEDRLRYVREAEAWVGSPISPLTKAEAEAVVQEWEKAESLDGAFGVLQASTAGLGDEGMARRALAQLEKAGLPRGADFALDRAEDGDPLAARKIMAAIWVSDPKDLPRLGEATTREITGAVDGLFQNGGPATVTSLAAAMTGQPALAARAAQERQLLMRLTQMEVAAGKDATMAAESAAATLYGRGGQAIVDEGLGAVTVPPDVAPDELRDGLAAVRAGLDLEHLAPRHDQFPNDGQFNLAVRDFAEYGNDLRGSGFWVDNGDGYSLVDPVSGFAVTGPDGQPRVWSAAEIAAAGRVAAVDRVESLTPSVTGAPPPPNADPYNLLGIVPRANAGEMPQ